MPSPYLPVPRTWSSQETVKATYLRSDVSGAVQLLSRPPLFIGSQTITLQTLSASGTDYAVTLDTETYDSAGGHLINANPDKYYGQFAGWYLAEASAPLSYVGSTGAFTCGIRAQQNGTPSTRMGMRIPNTSGFYSVCCGAKLVRQQVITTPGGSGDWISAEVSQNTGGSQALLNGTARYPSLSACWVCALSGTAPLPAPVNAAWPPPTTTLTAPASAGATSISVASATGMDYYGGLGGALGLDIGQPGSSGPSETVTITGVPSGLVVPVTALAYAHSSDAAVNVPVSAAFMNRNVRDAIAFLLYPPVMEYQYLATQFITSYLASQTVVPVSGNIIALDSVTADNYAAFATDTWTAPVAGTWYAYGQVAITSATTTQILMAGLSVTSANYGGGGTTTLWGGGIVPYSAAGQASCAMVRRRLRLNAGDKVSLAGFQRDSGGNAAVLLGAGDWSCRLITCWTGS